MQLKRIGYFTLHISIGTRSINIDIIIDIIILHQALQTTMGRHSSQSRTSEFESDLLAKYTYIHKESDFGGWSLPTHSIHGYVVIYIQ